MVKLKDLRKAQELLLKLRYELKHAEDVFSVNRAISYTCRLNITYDESHRTVEEIGDKKMLKALENMEKKVEIELKTLKVDAMDCINIGIDIIQEE